MSHLLHAVTTPVGISGLLFVLTVAVAAFASIFSRTPHRRSDALTVLEVLLRRPGRRPGRGRR
jgi:hypothetical protein